MTTKLPTLPVYRFKRGCTGVPNTDGIRYYIHNNYKMLTTISNVWWQCVLAAIDNTRRTFRRKSVLLRVTYALRPENNGQYWFVSDFYALIFLIFFYFCNKLCQVFEQHRRNLLVSQTNREAAAVLITYAMTKVRRGEIRPTALDYSGLAAFTVTRTQRSWHIITLSITRLK